MKAVQDTDFLYNQVVNRIARMIQTQVLKAGDKLPSVRALSEEQQISVSTAFKAYAELENRGLVEARPKSGYYVRATVKRPPWEPTPEEEEFEEEDLRPVDTDEMMSLLYRHISDPQVIRLSLSGPSSQLVPIAKLNKSMHHVLLHDEQGYTNYQSPEGNVQLRKQVARLCFQWGGVVTEQDVIATQGCMEALLCCIKAVTQPGDLVAIESPTYFGIFQLLKTLGLQVIEIPTHPVTGLRLPVLQRVLDQYPVKACVFIPNFSNPTGACMPDEQKQQLVKMLTDRQIPLIEDDIYGEMYYGQVRPRTCKSYDRKGWVLHCSSISKSLAPGYRVGWCLPGRFYKQVLQQKMILTLTSTSPTQAAIAHFLETGRYDLHMRHMRKALHLQSLQYTQVIQKYFPADIRISSPQGGYVLWIELPKKVDANQLFRKAMKEKISIAPGPLFSMDGRFTHHIRISFGNPLNRSLEEGIRTIGRLVKQMAERKGLKRSA